MSLPLSQVTSVSPQSLSEHDVRYSLRSNSIDMKLMRLFSSDIWAFGCIVYQLFTGKPPFRGATDYLTFQKILKKEMEFPPEFDDEAQSLIDVVLVGSFSLLL